MARIKAVVLAAGTSSRMGCCKLMLQLGEKTIIEKVVDLIITSGLERIIVVTGHCAAELQTVLSDKKICLLHNPHYLQGMSTSLIKAVRQVVQEDTSDAVLFFHGDMPFIKTATVRRIIAEYEKTKAPVIVPEYQGRKGHPVLFSREMFSELLTLSGDEGARQLLARHRDKVLIVKTDDSGISIDVDDSEDYRQAIIRVKPDETGYQRYSRRKK